MKEGVILLIWCVYLQHCIVISIYREYKAVITMLAPIKIMVIFDHEKDDISTNNPLTRLMVGGKAKFLRLASSHQVAISGRKVCKRQAKTIVRLRTHS